ncbi:hypothetical protein Taro_018626 [Colocasia esculenta]|uniref:Flavin-containing monooxygenase n=1 Tax=Colocasia esculenta TaxID=4460 RepID=A0A843UR84_COLES|nr:hypothetical protein [Colocasia esculenta]
MDCWRELEGKRVHDPFYYHKYFDDCSNHTATKATSGSGGCPRPGRLMQVDGPIIVGAGPSGLAVAACLKEKGVPSLVLERSDCVASLWQHRTYDRLRLHLPKSFCELPHMPFPAFFPTYPTKQQFLAYLDAYAQRFDINPEFNQTVVAAEYDQGLGFWRVKTKRTGNEGNDAVEAAKEYLCRWLVVATGENAEAVVPEIEGMGEFKGPVVHTSAYKTGEVFKGKRVLVVGCGNSGMEICLDLCNHEARPILVVRNSVHVLPRQILGRSTFGLSMWLLRWLPVRTVDRLLLLASRLALGDTAPLGIDRPRLGPLELKSISGKTPVLDVGTLAKIRSGDVKVCPAIKQLLSHGAEFANGRKGEFDAIVMATGYRSNVPSWLKEEEFFSEKDGLPQTPFPHGWKGQRGLYAVGFTKRGILGASIDARRIAIDIEQQWKAGGTKSSI